MRLSNFLAGMLGCAAIMACSNDLDSQIDNPGEEPNNGNSYMAINLTMGSGAGTKAASDGGYDYGTDAEGAVKISEAFFLFYDAEGNYLTTGTIAASEETNSDGYLPLTASTGTEGENTVESKSSAVVVLGPTETQPSQVLAVLNAGPTNNLAGKSLTDAISTIQNGSSDVANTKGSFIMSNSVYKDATNKLVYAQPVTTSNITTSAEDAKKAPVTIYVERAAAKISFSNSTKDFELPNPAVVNAKNVKMKVVIDGWCVNAYNQSTYLVKNLDASWASTDPVSGWTDWSNATRSYWAKDANYTGDGDYDQGPTYKELVYKKFSEANKTSGAAFYCYENTVDPTKAEAQGGDYANVTTVMIAAHIEAATGAEGAYEKQDLFKKGGVFYTENILKQNIAATSDYYWYYTESGQTATQHWVPITGEDLTLTITESATQTDPTKPAYVTIAISNIAASSDKNIPEGGILVKGDNSTTSVSVDNAKTDLNTNNSFTKNVEGYNDGACYYQVPIEQLTPSYTSTVVYGVVRNHSYVLTLNSVSQVGYPVWDKENIVRPIIPGDRGDYYVAATLNVLSWQVVNQQVDL